MAAGSASIAASLVHELRNPLAAVKGLLELIRRGDHDERTRGRLDVVLAEVARMEDMLRSRTAPPAPAMVDTGALVDDVIAVIEARAMAAGVTVHRTGAGAGAAVAGDRQQLKAALLNLVGNAIEATAPGGRVVITTVATGGEVAIEIADTGRGLAPDDLARLGTPFFTRRPGGTGLGVLLARATVTQHGGSLTYRSTPGMGTTARIVLAEAPLADSLRLGTQSLGRRGGRPAI
jgi:two-component system sporulation sensor kinase B